MCERVIKNPRRGQKVCNFKGKKRQTKCQIKLNFLRTKDRYKQAKKRRECRGGRVLPEPVVCDQCGYDIAHPEYAPLSATNLQMRCTVKNGRPGQKIIGASSECQVKYNNDRQNGKYKEKRQCDEKIIKLFLAQDGVPGSNGKSESVYPENGKPSTARGNYKQPDDERSHKIGRPVGSATQKGTRGKYSNADRKLRSCLGKLCTEEDKVTMFMSAGPFNRQCDRCTATKENTGGREVKWAGAHKID